jgi:hypothetical protein
MRLSSSTAWRLRDGNKRVAGSCSASCDLARLWQSQGEGRRRKALKLLQSAYDQFTEGFDTADLRDAKSLIRSLRKNFGRKQSEWTGKLGSCAGELTAS